MDGREAVSMLPANTLESDMVITNEDNVVFGSCFRNLLEEVKSLSSELKYRDCLTRCKILLDFIWEKLNTGHWKDVSLAWRKAYTHVSCFKASSQYMIVREKLREVKLINNETDSKMNDILIKNIKQILKTCDMGLIMGYSLSSCSLSRYASFIHKIYADLQKNCIVFSTNETSEMSPHDEPAVKKCRTAAEESIEIVYNPSIEYFQKFIMKNGKPVLLKNCMDNWPALGERRWSVEYIKKVAGGRLVPVEIGSKYTDDEWSQKLMTIEDFINQYMFTGNTEKEKGYLAQYQLFNQIEDLRRDIIIPDYCAIGCEEYDENVDINAWFGPAHTVSPLHRDEKANLFCQVFGQKYFKMYDPAYSDKLHIHDNHLLQTTSQIDIENVDSQKFPDFHEIPYTEITLEAGDMLYIPPMYWHFVKSLSSSFSVTFWWGKCK